MNQAAAPRGNKRTTAEMLERSKQDLANIEAKDVSKLDPQKLAKHEAKINGLKTQIAG